MPCHYRTNRVFRWHANMQQPADGNAWPLDGCSYGMAAELSFGYDVQRRTQTRGADGAAKPSRIGTSREDIVELRRTIIAALRVAVREPKIDQPPQARV